MGSNWDATATTLSIILSSGLSAAACKFFIQKSLSDLETAIKEIGKIKQDLSAIAVRLEGVDRYQDMALHHDRKISALEASFNGSGHKPSR